MVGNIDVGFGEFGDEEKKKSTNRKDSDDSA